ncbi:uncharacterized protein V6R79_010920 [Siganus canaliculatus]
MEEQQQNQGGFCSFSPDWSACCQTGVHTSQSTMRLSITSSTGSPVELTVPQRETVEGLRARLSQKLRLPSDRIVLLHRDRQLTAGKLLKLGVADGSKLTLIPVIEAGLVHSATRAEKTMTDILESLTEDQISDFLSGRSPLTIKLRVGGQVMYVQLQLSAQNVAELQQLQDLKSPVCSEHETGLTPAAAPMKHPGCMCGDITGSTAASASPTSIQAQDLSASTQKPSSSFSSTSSSCHSSTTAPAVTNYHHCSPHQALPPHAMHTSSAVSTPLPCGCLHPSCAAHAATAVCSPVPTGATSGPQSPAPASTFKEMNNDAVASTELCKQPGAIIESFVNHSPGVFSGTFSGTLNPCSQSSISPQRSGRSIILQILDDLLRAAYHHQGATSALSHLPSPLSNPPVRPQRIKARSRTLIIPGVDEENRVFQSSTRENHTLHHKLERLQFLMHQRRLHRQNRRKSCLP